MKGIVFREFVEMVENSYSPQMMDTLITSAIIWVRHLHKSSNPSLTCILRCSRVIP